MLFRLGSAVNAAAVSRVEYGKLLQGDAAQYQRAALGMNASAMEDLAKAERLIQSAINKLEDVNEFCSKHTAKMKK
tara:strand:- start:58 stop:285 length:228 start_codon:yes stop_codon:yes gene_type:complete